MDSETARALTEEGLDDGGAGPSGVNIQVGGSGGGGDLSSRRSGRSIKRKKFDDELVDSMSTSYPKPLKPPSAEQDMLMEGVIEGVGDPLHLQFNHLQNGGPFTVSQHQPTMTQSTTTGLGPLSTALPPSLATTSLSASLPLSASSPASSGLSTPLFVQQNRKKKSGSKNGNQVAFAPNAHSFDLAALENNYWKPADDLALIVNVEQTNDLVKVHQGVKFSIKFTLADLEARWYSLLYDVQAKNLSLAAIRQLHPDVVTAVQSRALFSDEEEAVLRKVESRSVPKVEDFQQLLDDHPTIFLPSRTAKLLRKHWVLLRHYQLLEDQTLLPLPRHESVVSFSEIERVVEQELEDEERMRQQHPSTSSLSGTLTSAGVSTTPQLHQQHSSTSQTPQPPGGSSQGQTPHQPQNPLSANSEAASQEILSSIRKSMLEIRMLENEIPKYQWLLDSITGITPSDFDNNTFAVLRGRLVRYLMRSREVTIGRSTKDFVVDVDLSLEGPSSKISRMQAIIRLSAAGEFNLFNAGKRPIFVDGKPLLTESSVRVYHNSLLDFSTLKFVFLINQDLVANMRHEELVKV